MGNANSLQSLVARAEKEVFEYMWEQPQIIAARDKLSTVDCTEDKRGYLNKLYRDTVRAYARGIFLKLSIGNQEGLLKGIRAFPKDGNEHPARFNGKYRNHAYRAWTEMSALNEYLNRMVYDIPYFLDEAERQRGPGIFVKSDPISFC